MKDYDPILDWERGFELINWLKRQDMIRDGKITPTKFDEQPPEWAKEATRDMDR